MRVFIFMLLFLIMPIHAEDSYGIDAQGVSIATFAGGDFWSMQKAFDEVSGVKLTLVGYMGGGEHTASYESVISGNTEHRHVVRVFFDPNIISYLKLLDVFWRNIDPTDRTGQFCEKGLEYTSAIFYENELQKNLATYSLNKIKKKTYFLIHRVYTEILPVKTFYEAEANHQFYYKKHDVSYDYYRIVCGRDAQLKKIWSNL